MIFQHWQSMPYNFWVEISYFFISGLFFSTLINTLRPKQNGGYFADDIQMNEKICLLIQVSLKFATTGMINKIDWHYKWMGQITTSSPPSAAYMGW